MPRMHAWCQNEAALSAPSGVQCAPFRDRWVTGSKPLSEYMFSELLRVADIVAPADSLKIAQTALSD